MSVTTVPSVQNDFGGVQAEFLSLYPAIARHARFVFRGRNPVDRNEAEAEAVAGAFESFVKLKARGKDPERDFPTMLGTYAVLQVKDDRHVGGRSSSKDVLSRKARLKHGFAVESLSSSHQTYFPPVRSGQRSQDEWEERLRENKRTPVPDQVSFRLDFPAFLRTLSPRDRRLARFLALGNSAKAAAKRFKICQARVTQLRKRWQAEWSVFQQEALPTS